MYDALVEVKPVTVIRDYDRDSSLDFYNGEKQTGNFGINIHRAESSGSTKLINKYSAGCQVFQDAEDFAQFIALPPLEFAHTGLCCLFPPTNVNLFLSMVMNQEIPNALVHEVVTCA